MENPRIVRIEWAPLEGRRPRVAGCNARRETHGAIVRPPIARITTDDGSVGFGASRITRDQASALVGKRLADAFESGRGAAEPWLSLEYPLWDLVARRSGKPVYALLDGARESATLHRVRCYDTSLYIDDLDLTEDAAAAVRIADEAREGFDRGHRAFKIKVGRGARHMPLEAGTRRDIAVIRAVRAAVGDGLPIMIDANNGYNLNLAKRVLAETAECDVFWLEEAFHEDDVLYRDLREWLDRHGLATLIADGEGQASPTLMDWARDRVVDVVQYDILRPGFTRWLEIGRQLDSWEVRSAPHNYGNQYGNYASCHLARAIRGFAFVEWDEATTEGLDTSEFRIDDGWVTVPDRPGFGLELDDGWFRRAVEARGFVVTV